MTTPPPGILGDLVFAWCLTLRVELWVVNAKTGDPTVYEAFVNRDANRGDRAL